jgi:ketosteroid isomerase-like protein
LSASVSSRHTRFSAAFTTNIADSNFWYTQQVSDPKVITFDVKPLGPSAAREIGTFSLKTKGPTPQEVTGKYVVVWEKVGEDWKLAADIWNDGK